MKKKWITVLSAAIVILTGGCGTDKAEKNVLQNTPETQTEVQAVMQTEAQNGVQEVMQDELSVDQERKNVTPEHESEQEGGLQLQGTYEEILNGIEKDMSETIEKLKVELERVELEIGTDYNGYVEHVDLLEDWYELVLSEEKGIFERMNQGAKAYYTLLVSSPEWEDWGTVDDITDDFYDRIYEDALDEFYDAVYEDAMEEVYDTYYEGIVKNGKDKVPYGDWLDTRSDCYGDWLDTRSDIYGDWLDARSDIYGDWLDIRSEFYEKDFDSVMKKIKRIK